jgi:monovalent cation/proton antiporter MnhG/PhaG subunit
VAVTHYPIFTGFLLGAAVVLTILCSLGLLVMRDAYQRIHFTSPIVTLSMLFVAVAVFIEESDSQARIKVVVIYVLMLVMNSVLSHATARAIRIREQGYWPPRPPEQIPVLNDKGIAGMPPYDGEAK